MKGKSNFWKLMLIAAVLIAVLVFATLLGNSKSESVLTGSIAGSLQDIRLGQPYYDSVTGKVTMQIKLGKATTDSIIKAQYAAEAANTVAKMIDFVSYGKALQKAKGNTTYLKVADLVKNLTKMNPAAVAQTILGWMTGAFANAVDQDCMVKAVNATSRNRDGSVTLYRLTNFFSEDSRVYNGYYVYSQNEWGNTSCKERKICLQFLYYSGRTTGCWF